MPTPDKWDDSELRFAHKLEQLLDELYQWGTKLRLLLRGEKINDIGLSQNSYTDEDKSRLSEIETNLEAVQTAQTKMLLNVIEVTLPNVSASSRTFNAQGITANHELVQDGFAYLSNPKAAGSDLTLTTSANRVAVGGTLIGTTNIKATFCIKSQKINGTA